MFMKTLAKIYTVFFAISICLPAMSHASDSVSRAEFVEEVVNQFSIPLKAVSLINTKSYPRVPTTVLPAFEALHSRKALAVFGTSFSPSRSITRGEAVRIVVAVKNATTSKMVTFRDVPRNTPLQKAVSVAVERNWLQPMRENYFGANDTLSLEEMNLLIGKATGKIEEGSTSTEQSTIPTTPNVTTIQIPLQRKNIEVPNQELVETVWQLLQDDYLYETKIDEVEAGYSIAESVTKSLNDPYTTFMRPQKTKNFMIGIDGQVVGIGAQVEQINGLLTVIAPLPNSPAERAGILPGDIILKVDDEDITTLALDEAVNKIRGKKGTIARLTIQRNYSSMTIFVERDTVRVPDYEISWQGNIAVVHIMQFGQNTNTKLRKELIDLNAKNPAGIILDLRNNPGGLLDAAGVVVSAFVPKKSTFAYIASRNSTVPSYTYDEPVINASVPMVVLVNGGSASASEITAGALQDMNRAKLVGTKTFGKGTVQQIHQFTDGSSLKLTIAEWLTPNKRKIDHVGIEPDYIVEQSPDRDNAMLKALQLLR